MQDKEKISGNAPICGVYAIYSACNDTTYIGHSSNITQRWTGHRSALRRGDKKKCNKHLLAAWNLYGEEAFEWTVLEECDENQLHIREQYHLDQHPNHYNWGECAASPHRGVPHTSEHKANISAGLMGHEVTPESREKMSASATGRKASPEARVNLSAAHMGITHTAEQRTKISAALTGRELSDEHKAKIGASRSGKKASPEARANVSVAHVGLKQTDEAKAKVSASLIGNTRRLGTKHNDEAKAKMSAAQAARRERERAAKTAAEGTIVDSSSAAA